MSRRAAHFTQSDIARILRAAAQVAPGKWRVRVSRAGEILVEPIEGPAPISDPTPQSAAAGEETPVAPLREFRL